MHKLIHTTKAHNKEILFKAPQFIANSLPQLDTISIIK